MATIDSMKIQKWLSIFKEAKCSGVAQPQWAEQHGISKSTYWYWHKKIGDKLAVDLVQSEPVFTELIPPEIGHSSSPAVIRKGGFSIEISDDISDHLLKRILKAVSDV